MKMMQMEYFLKVAEKLNFTIAAKELFISQPALSKQIMLLEKSLGVKLFYRDNKCVKLTAAGEKLQMEMAPLVKQMASVLEEVKNLGGSQEMVRIGCFTGLETRRVLDEVEKRLLMAGAGGVDIMLYEVQELKEHLLAGEIDMGIILDFSLPYFGEFDYQVLECRTGSIIYSKQHLLSQKKVLHTKDFCGQTFVTVDEMMNPGAKKRLCENLEKCKITPNQIISAPNMMTVISYIDRGVGMSILSQEVVKHKEYKWNKWDLPSQAIQLKVVGITVKGNKNNAVSKLFSGYNQQLLCNE